MSINHLLDFVDTDLKASERGRFEQIGRPLCALRPLYTRPATFDHFSLFPRFALTRLTLLPPLCVNSELPQVNTVNPLPLLTRRNHNNHNSCLVPRTERGCLLACVLSQKIAACLWIPT